MLAWLQSLPADEEEVTNEVQALRDDPTVTGKYSQFAKVVVLGEYLFLFRYFFLFSFHLRAGCALAGGQAIKWIKPRVNDWSNLCCI